LHSKEIGDFCSSQNIIRAIKSRKVRWVEHDARMMKKNAYRVLVRKRDNKPLVIYRCKCEVDIERRVKGRRWK